MEVKEAFENLAKPSIAIDLVMLRVGDTGKSKRLQILLVKEANEDLWHLPGSILRLGETPKDVIARITDNKVNTGNTEFEQLYTVADDPLRDERGHIISIVYIGICKQNTMDDVKVTNSDYDTQWYWIGNNENQLISTADDTDELTSLKYDHDAIIHDTLERIKGKLRYTDIGFKFIEDKFTLSELEMVYCAINGNPIPGFRRIIRNSVIGTGEMSKGESHRPSEFFIKK